LLKTFLGIDYKSKNITVNDKAIKLKIWDTAGQERFRNITQQYYKNADGILLVFDVSDKNSFEKVREWMKQIQMYTQKDSIGIVLVGNKCDVENRLVSKEEGEAVASEFNIKYFEASALNNYNIEETFNYLSQDIMRIKDNKDAGANNGDPKPNVVTLKEKSQVSNAGAKEKKCC
jgi:Ras-related protein Rab-8A